jgi:hypothetical protein
MVALELEPVEGEEGREGEEERRELNLEGGESSSSCSSSCTAHSSLASCDCMGCDCMGDWKGKVAGNTNVNGGEEEVEERVEEGVEEEVEEGVERRRGGEERGADQILEEGGGGFEPSLIEPSTMGDHKGMVNHEGKCSGLECSEEEGSEEGREEGSEEGSGLGYGVEEYASEKAYGTARAQLRAFYEEVEPSRVGRVDSILAKFTLHELQCMLRAKYGTAPSFACTAPSFTCTAPSFEGSRGGDGVNATKSAVGPNTCNTVGPNTYQVMFKSGDDLRQDQLIMQVL